MRKAPPIWDFVLAGLSIAVYGYMIKNYTAIALRGGYLEAIDYIVAGIDIVLVFEAARRACGSLAVLALVFPMLQRY